MKLILASSSPRRRQLLDGANYDFEVVEPHIDEAYGLCSNCGPAELVQDLARRKAEHVVGRLQSQGKHKPRIVIACDTIAECNGQILGKPRDEEHALAMLTLLSGKEHRVYSGLCVWPLPSGSPIVRVDVTTLTMDPLTNVQLESYLDSHNWEGKAGAFGYQDGLDWVHIIRGSESNVVGLPMELLDEMLASMGK